MNYGRKTPSMGTPSVYSHVTTRSSANLKSSRSLRSVRIPWYQKPILQDAIVLDIQRGALVTGFYSLVSWYIVVELQMGAKYRAIINDVYTFENIYQKEK